jgi:hypothetical protein
MLLEYLILEEIAEALSYFTRVNTRKLLANIYSSFLKVIT